MDSVGIKSLKEGGEHSYHRRAINHDYYAPFIYHIILKKNPGCEDFGSIAGNARIAPGSSGCAYVDESELGKIIAKAILHLPHEYPIIKLFQFCIMPDHVHILLQILFRSDKHLDFYMDNLCKNIASRYSKHLGRQIEDTEIFIPGYCDKPLLLNRNLDALFLYIRQNPHRLAMRRQCPQFFRLVRKLKLGDTEYAAYGNLFLLRNPDKSAVKVSRSFTDEEKLAKKSGWLAGAAKGTILVSPFISKSEKDIRADVEALGGRIILITHEAFPERFKPAAHDFDLCSEGRLLILSLGYPIGASLTRQICQQMNSLAEAIASNGAVF